MTDLVADSLPSPQHSESLFHHGMANAIRAGLEAHSIKTYDLLHCAQEHLNLDATKHESQI